MESAKYKDTIKSSTSVNINKQSVGGEDMGYLDGYVAYDTGYGGQQHMNNIDGKLELELNK